MEHPAADTILAVEGLTVDIPVSHGTLHAAVSYTHLTLPTNREV